MANVPGIPDPQVAGQAYHRRQYVDFKVVVYRLQVPDAVAAIKLIDGGEVNANDVLSRDFNDIAYQDISGRLNKLTDQDVSVFADFLDKFAGVMQNAMTDIDQIPLTTQELSDAGIFKEIDITPIVRSANTQMVLEGCNACTITTIDPYLSAFDDSVKATYVFDSPLPSPAYAGVIKGTDLDGFNFREFDLIRVFATASI